MFHVIPVHQKKIEFSSNPPILEEVIAEPKEVEGKIRNSFRKVPSSNRSILSDLVYNEETMSLRAKLNMGLPMTVVSNPNIDDFDKAYKVAGRMSAQIEKKLADLQREENAAAAAAATVDSVVNEDVKS